MRDEGEILILRDKDKRVIKEIFINFQNFAFK